MSQARILVVHTNARQLDLLESMLQSLNHRIENVENDRAAVKSLEKAGADLVLAGVDPEDPEALELLAYVRRKHARTPVIPLFLSEHRDRAREATRMGAANVLRYPCTAHDLRAAVTQALATSGPYNERSAAQVSGGSAAAAREGGAGFEIPPAIRGEENAIRQLHFIGEDPAIRRAIDLAHSAANSRTPVLVTGEQGTGKSLLARIIHQTSARREGPFLEAGATTPLGEAALDRELFGTPGENSAYDRPGKLVRAHRGTLVIDEAAALSPALQAKLARYLEEGYTRVGDSGEQLAADTRLVLLSRHDLGELVERGEFRRDLYYRISTLTAHLPPLRKRRGDIERLADYFHNLANIEQNKKIVGFTTEALDVLNRHPWPGNVAELKSVVERGVILTRGSRITPVNLQLDGLERGYADVGSGGGSGGGANVVIRPLKEALEEPEKQIILTALEKLNWNRQETARVLDINRTTLYKKMKKYGLLVEDRQRANLTH